MRRLAFLLYPFAVLFDLITRVRNWLYNSGVFKTTPSPIPAILVGNLRVGGTGKTPMVEYLIRTFKQDYRLATLSRGYGRKTEGFIKATSVSSPEGIGDEPFQIYQKFGDEIRVFVGEDRVNAAAQIAKEEEGLDLLILDDAFQHRSFQADFSILLTTWEEPFFQDFLLPMGRLRESRNGAKRADLIIVTKSPLSKSNKEASEFQENIRQYAGSKPVLFTKVGYGEPQALAENSQFRKRVILFSGIANNQQFIDYCKSQYEVLEAVKFSDHHHYDQADLEKIGLLVAKHANENPVILTTEKDGVKVKSLLPKGFLREIPIFVLPIQVLLEEEDEQKLIKMVQQKVFETDKAR